MHYYDHQDKGLGFMPMHCRGYRTISDHRFKVKVRRHERRKSREEMRLWLGYNPASGD